MERLDYRLLEEETETVLGFARHGPGFRSVKETGSRAGRKRKLSWALLDTTDQDSGLLKRQYHEQGGIGDSAGLCQTRTWIQVC
jgi:hypothetical protein